MTPTPADRLGPAYRKGAPFRARLATEAEPGIPLLLTGRIVSANTGRPLPGALVDVWQTDARGLYSNLLGLPGLRRRPRAMTFRGRMYADPDGAYRLGTVIPGHYPLGPLSRPRHIHFLVTHPDCEPLITQLYFAGDPLLGRDPFATAPLILSPRARRDEHGHELRGREAAFDFALIERKGAGRA